jgi:redox-sensitive bicupin YhaK (pirin superfamily)
MIEHCIIPRTHDIGNFEVRRALPSREKQMVGPFIFWDQMGPGEFVTGAGVDVRPHPHIGLSTLTYLFDGSLMHRDSLGTAQMIEAGVVNLMTAGKGIVHSERTGADTRHHPHRLFGIQSWLALPRTHEEASPSFDHISADALPVIKDNQYSGTLIAGAYQGIRSPLSYPHESFYMDLHLQSGAFFELPRDQEELAIYPLSGRLQIEDTVYDPMQLLILKSGALEIIKAIDHCHVMIFGGAVMDGPRHIWWNFVSSSADRIAQTREDWTARRFDPVPGEHEFIPLPGS